MMKKFCFTLASTHLKPNVRKNTYLFMNAKKHLSSISRAQAEDILRKAEAVCFDVDSTVVTEEGIDVLAAFKGSGEEVAEWTRKAMGGSVLFEDALAARLQIIKPSRQDIDNCIKAHPLKLTPGVKEFITAIHRRDKPVYLVSGGFRQMIAPIADAVQIPQHRIYANEIKFSETDGSYTGFDDSEPTSRDGGKSHVIKLLKDIHGYRTVVMIGDGVTDMQARPPADLFIGFGGVIVREPVKAGADWYVMNFQELLDAL